MRFHSWCPPEAAFEAADELGFFLQPEAGMWNPISPGTPMEKELYSETDRIIRAFGNHPSFVTLSPSNEPAGKWKESLPKWIVHYRAVDLRHLTPREPAGPTSTRPGPPATSTTSRMSGKAPDRPTRCAARPDGSEETSRPA